MVESKKAGRLAAGLVVPLMVLYLGVLPVLLGVAMALGLEDTGAYGRYSFIRKAWALLNPGPDLVENLLWVWIGRAVLTVYAISLVLLILFVRRVARANSIVS